MLSKEARLSLELDDRLYLCYDYLFAITEHKVLATHGSNMSLITTDGVMLCTYDMIYVPMYYTNEHYDKDSGMDIADSEYVDAYLVFIKDGKKGVMDYDANIIIEPIYRDIIFDSNEHCELLP